MPDDQTPDLAPALSPVDQGRLAPELGGMHMVRLRKLRLGELERALGELVAVLERDRECRWIRVFRGFQAEARAYMTQDVTLDTWTGFLASIMSVYGGMGTFTDYVPPLRQDPQGGWFPAPGFEGLDALSSRVYALASAMRGL